MTAEITTRDISIVFETWCRHAHKNVNVKLSDKRSTLIRKALTTYGMETVIDAVVGWRYSSHHSGDNDRRTVYNDIELILRDNSHIERFAEFTRIAREKGLAPPTESLIVLGGAPADPSAVVKPRGAGYQGVGTFTRAGAWSPRREQR